MFKALKQQLSGALSYQQLSDRLDDWIASVDGINRSDHTDVVHDLVSSTDWLKSWREGQLNILEGIAEAASKQDQVIALRAATIDQIEKAAHAGAALSDTHNDEDRQILRDRLFPHRTIEEALGECDRGRIFAMARILSLREISRELGDARDHDWLSYFSDLHRQLAEHAIAMMIAEAKDEAYPLESFVPALRQMAADARTAALDGENWTHDEAALARDGLEQEARERDLEPPRQPDVTSEQLLALSDLLVDRMKRIRGGSLYRFGDKRPTVPEQIFTVDTALMLIAMDDCLIDRQVAERGLRQVISIAMDGFRRDPMPAEEVNLDVQHEFLELWRENAKEPPLPRFCFAAAHLLFDIEPVDDDAEHSSAVGDIGAALLEDAWYMLASTKKVFGYRLEANLFNDS